ncbi:MAG: DUF4173 domain-containing protein, partial [Agathobacter sp.]|nr:DUF4173 domain-containing protein [Agathobacter sp.]
KTGLFLLTISFVLGLFYDTGKWGLGKHLGTIIGSCFMAVGQIYTPFSDALWYVRNKLDKKNSKYLYALLGLVITIPIFAIVFLLLLSADLVFRDMAEKVLKNMSVGDVFLIGLLIVFMTMVGYCLMTLLAKGMVKEEVKEGKKWEPLVGIPVVLFLSLLYLVFSVIQILYLFIGNMQLPKEYTYAEYAREGFFQLLAVAILNLVIVLICLNRFKSNKFLKGLLVIMSLCTFVMIASSGLRMMIYIQYYYLTFLRILVLWALIVLTVLFLGVIIATIKGKFPLFRYSIVVVTCFYLCLSFSHPDYWIAKVNVDGTKETRSEFFKGDPYKDYYFLTNLSADAAPIMVEWVKENGYDLNYYYWDYEEDGTKDEWDGTMGYMYLHNLQDRVGDIGVRNFNLSRFVADKKVENLVNLKGQKEQ